MADEIPGLTADEQKFLETRGESGLPDTPAAPAEQAPAAPVPPAPLEAPTEQPETPEPEEEEAEADDGAIDPSTGKHHPRKIAYRKFRALEEQFQSQQEELARMREVLARGDERMKIINEALTEPPPAAAVEEEEDPRPDPQQDVFAYLEWKERQDRRAFEQISEHFENQVQEREQQSFAAQQQEEIAQTVGRYRAEAQQVVAANPRFVDAYTHLVRVRNDQYQALGIMDPTERAHRIAQEEYAVVSSAYSENVSPFQRLYALAVASGFDPNNPNAAPAAAAVAGATVGTQPRTGGGRPQPSVAEIIENVRSGQQAAMSLSRGGGVPGDRLTSEILGNMSQKDFDYMMEHLPADRIKELLGGG